MNAGFPVVVDTTFLAHNHRLPYLKTTEIRSIPYAILDCDAPFEELCERILNRGSDPSDATIDVLKMQMENHDPFTIEELMFVNRLL